MSLNFRDDPVPNFLNEAMRGLLSTQTVVPSKRFRLCVTLLRISDFVFGQAVSTPGEKSGRKIQANGFEGFRIGTGD